MAPWGWECRARLIKQVKTKPTERRPTKWDGFVSPGPSHYNPPTTIGGPGFSKIRRAPAYTFGVYIPVPKKLSSSLPKAPLFNISDMTRKGRSKIPQGIIAERCEIPGDRCQKPGPGTHSPKDLAQRKRPPAYSMRIAAKPPYEPWDTWTPSANMYCPPIPGKKWPAYSFGDSRKAPRSQQIPGPGDHDPNFDYVKTSKPAFSLGFRFRPLTEHTIVPAPNAYCEKRYMYAKRSAPAPSFGIRHSRYLGMNNVYEMPSKLELLSRDLV